MNKILPMSALLGCVLLAASCSQQVQPVKKAGRSPVYVGKVERVYPRHNYVLIALAGIVYEPGTVLISQSAGSGENRRVANLIVTEERMGRTRIPADIRSGTAEAGDLVFLYQNLAAPESSGKTGEEPTDTPEPGKEITPPVSPDGLLPLPGERPAEPEAPADKPSRSPGARSIQDEIMKDLDTVPGTLEDSLRAVSPEKKSAR